MAFRGLIATVPVGLQGFNGSRNPSKLGPGNFSMVEGVDIDGGVITKDGGAEKLNTTAVGSGSDRSILAGISWSASPGTTYDVIFVENGSMLRDAGLGTFPTTLRSGLNAPTLFNPHFVVAGGEAVGATRKLFMFSESNQVQVVSGTGATAADIADPPADWASSFPIVGVLHGNRLWGAGNASDPHRLYYSMISDHGDFIDASAGTLSVFPGEGDQIVGIKSFRGLMLVAKYPRGIYVVDTRDPSVSNWSVQRLNDAVGGVSPQSFLQISNDMLILDAGANFHIASTIDDISDIRTSDAGKLQDISTFMRANVNLAGLRKACGMWYAVKSKAWFMVPQVGAVDNNLRVMIDFNEPQVGPRFLLSERDVGNAIWARRDSTQIERPTLGDDIGFVWIMDQEERNKDGAAYQMYFETSDNDFSYIDPDLAGRTKNGVFIELVADIVNRSLLDVTPVWDGFPGVPINVQLGTAGAVLGSFVLDSDALASSGIATVKSRLPGQGRRLKLIMENNELDDEVRLSEVRILMGIADERLRTE